MQIGLRIRDVGSDALTWADLRSFVKYLGPDSAVARELYPDAAPWQLPQLLLADVVDSLRILIWQKTKDGHRNMRRPKPIPRPGVETESVMGTDVMSLDEADQFLGWDRKAV